MTLNQIFNDLKTEWLGKRVGDPTLVSEGVPESEIYQCVSLIKQMLREKYGITPGAWGNASVYFTNPNALLLTKFTKLQTTAVQIGDIVVFSFDHIGIASGVQTATTVEVLDQNGGKGTGTGEGVDAIGYHTFSKSKVFGVLRPQGIPVSAPAYAPVHVGDFLNLPAAAASWRVYNPLTPSWTANPDTSVGTLNPAKYATNGYLTYQILGSPKQDWYTIQTRDYGQVVIYAAASTGAVIAANDLPIVAPVPVVPAPAPAPTNIEYTKLDTPLNLFTNKQPTHLWALDFATDGQAVSQAEFPEGAAFAAYGKAQRTDGDKPCYYMTQTDFGQADTTGHTDTNVGINTVDLSLAPEPTTEPQPTATSETTGLASASAPMTSITPVAPPVPDWQKTTKNVADYEAVQNFDVEDLATGIPVSKLLTGQTVHAAVRFEKDGVMYVMTKKSIDAGKFNGVPMGALKLIKAIDVANEDLLDDLDLSEIGGKIKDIGEIAERIIDPLLKNTTLREKVVDFVARFVFRAKKQKV